MAIPTQTFNILQNGIGFGDSNYASMIVIGVDNTLTTTTSDVIAVASAVKAKELFGNSPLGEATGLISNEAGICYAIKVPNTRTQLVAQAMAESGSGTSPNITIDGYSDFDFDFRIKVITPTTYQFTLDGYNYSATRTLPATGGSNVIPGSGLTVTFASGTYVANEVYSYSTVGPKITTGGIASAFAKILADGRKFGTVLVYDGLVSSATGSTNFGLLKTELIAAGNNYRWMRGILDVGSNEASKATVVTAAASIESDRISPVCDKAQVFSALAREGWVTPKLGLVVDYAARVAKCLISEDPGQVSRGPLSNIFALENDARTNDNGLDAVKIVTGMKYVGKSGYFITNSHLKSASGSDFKYIQHGRVMDMACSVVYENQANFLKAPVRVVSGGSIDERDALKYEGFVQSSLDDALLSPTNSAGNKGHVSRVAYQIDRTNNVLTSETLITTVYIRPLAYPNVISTTIGFSATAE